MIYDVGDWIMDISAGPWFMLIHLTISTLVTLPPVTLFKLQVILPVNYIIFTCFMTELLTGKYSIRRVVSPEILTGKKIVIYEVSLLQVHAS